MLAYQVKMDRMLQMQYKRSMISVMVNTCWLTGYLSCAAVQEGELDILDPLVDPKGQQNSPG